jgi:hypothetical protein
VARAGTNQLGGMEIDTLKLRNQIAQSWDNAVTWRDRVPTFISVLQKIRAALHGPGFAQASMRSTNARHNSPQPRLLNLVIAGAADTSGAARAGCVTRIISCAICASRAAGQVSAWTGF